MALIALLLALTLEHFLSPRAQWRSFAWTERLYTLWHARLGHLPQWEGPIGVLIYLVVPLGLMLLAQWQLAELWLGLIGLAFATLALWYSLGPDNLRHQLQAFQAAEGDEAHTLAENLAGETLEPQDSPTEAVIQAALRSSCDAIFGVVFWFVVLGPSGALLFAISTRLPRLESIAPDSGFQRAAAHLHWLLGWIPTRITALFYALVGSFDDCFRSWRGFTPGCESGLDDPHQEMLLCIGRSAIRLHEKGSDESALREGLSDTSSLLLRTLIIWTTLIALITIVGWVQ